jgi:hypothetical protein
MQIIKLIHKVRKDGNQNPLFGHIVDEISKKTGEKCALGFKGA